MVRIGSLTRGQKLFLAAALVVWVSFLVWLAVSPRGNTHRSFDQQCKAQCHPLPHRIDVKLLNPTIGPERRGNVRSTRCVCGTAP